MAFDPTSTKVPGHFPVKMGRSLSSWIKLVRARGASMPSEAVTWLRREHGLSHAVACDIVGEAFRTSPVAPTTPYGLVAAQYSGPRAGLRPIYDRLVEAASSMGPDVRFEPAPGHVALARRAVFALIQAPTRSRIDLGLRLRGVPATGGLRPAGSFGAGQVTHRLHLTSPADIDEDVAGWLAMAYTMAR
jgi:hypothetical protein